MKLARIFRPVTGAVLVCSTLAGVHRRPRKGRSPDDRRYARQVTQTTEDLYAPFAVIGQWWRPNRRWPGRSLLASAWLWLAM
jgi:hypothetical protein